MLEGVWIEVGTAKFSAKQNGDRVVEIPDIRRLSKLHTDCYHVIIGIKP